MIRTNNQIQSWEDTCYMVKKITDKLNEYGFNLYETYSVDKIHHFLVEDMVLFLNLETNHLQVAFKAGTRAEDSARNVLILYEVAGLKNNIEIMESFIYDDNKKLLYGEEAHTFIKKSVANGVLTAHFKAEQELKFLVNAKIEGHC